MVRTISLLSYVVNEIEVLVVTLVATVMLTGYFCPTIGIVGEEAVGG